MERKARGYLADWTTRPDRRPLIIRGARQVGKSHLVRWLADSQFDEMLEINLEVEPNAASLFESKQPSKIIPLLEARYGVRLEAGRSLLFLDEIQERPELLACLRYFYERRPDLHVIAAGSLLDFALADHDFSMPVGRIEYLHLGPMTFGEFLVGKGRATLSEFLESYQLGEDLPIALHEECLQQLRDYLIVGGMPASIQAFVDGENWVGSDRIKQNLIQTYRDDFAKYSRRVDQPRLDLLFSTIPRLIGSKFMYSRVDREDRARNLGRALDLLRRARLVHVVRHSASNGIPLGAEADDRVFKVVYLDVGLLCRMAGLSLADMEPSTDLMLINSGAICEQFVGQHLLQSGAPYEDPELFCWIRQKAQSNAEVDYVIAVGDQVVPVEVKSGRTGTLRSLHSFLQAKKRGFALRFNADAPSLTVGSTSMPKTAPHDFRLLSLPLYMVDQTRRLCRDALS